MIATSLGETEAFTFAFSLPREVDFCNPTYHRKSLSVLALPQDRLRPITNPLES